MGGNLTASIRHGALSLKSASRYHYFEDKMIGFLCISALIAVTAGQAPPPPPSLPPPPPPPSYGPPRPGYPMRPYGRPPMGPFGGKAGGIDPLTLLAFQKGGLGGNGDDNLLPLLLLGGGGLGGHPGKGGLGGGLGGGHGGFNPLTLLAFQNGGLGGSGGNDNLLPLLLLGGGGVNGPDGEKMCCVCKKA